MFGIRGLDLLGLFHASVGLLALLLGLGVVSFNKGTRRHKRIGYAYVVTMVLLNGTALGIYDLYGGFGPFHVAAGISLITVGVALVPAVTRRPAGNWLRLHAEVMCWSYVGLASAFVAEIAVRLPGSRTAPAAISTVVGTAAGAVLIYRFLPAVVAQLRNAQPSARDRAVARHCETR